MLSFAVFLTVQVKAQITISKLVLIGHFIAEVFHIKSSGLDNKIGIWSFAEPASAFQYSHDIPAYTLKMIRFIVTESVY